MAKKRTPISKTLRFRIFARDTFTCRYCGLQPPGVMLVIDHLVPVVEGGTNDEENLITACQAGNQGKGPKQLKEHVPTEAERLRIAQEYMEQLDLAELAKEAAGARMQIRDQICDYFCEACGSDGINRRHLSQLVKLVDEFGVQSVLEFIDMAISSTGLNRDNVMKYIHGIVRKKRESGT